MTIINTCCNKRAKGFAQINNALYLATIHSTLFDEYTGGKFNYCPYCGTKLIYEEKDYEKLNLEKTIQKIQ